MTAPDVTHDPELESVAWNLDPLLDGGAGEAGAPETSPKRIADIR